MFGLLTIVSAYSQQTVTDFASAMTSAPVGKKSHVTDVVYDNDVYNGMEKRTVKWRRPDKSTRDRYAAMGRILDSLKLIDYKKDTIYIYSAGYLPDMGSVSEVFKSKNSRFFFHKDSAGKYSIRFYDGEYDDSADPRMIASDRLFFNTIFSWDIDKFIDLIKASGGYEASDWYYYATRIILQDNRVRKKDVIHFRQVMFWHL
jgi:hypothetical protein